MATPASSASTPAPEAQQQQQHTNVIPSEVGWQFVPQYYTYMNKQPNRLHCFYTKNSTFIHGTEGEDVKPCYGQHEIHNRIVSIGFNDCKVFINSVDAQSSVNGGIIIQVIGEMSNNGEAWRKFAQTFFLAEQPNGYFVLNDIFRYLKEEAADTEEIDGAEPVAPAAAATEPQAAAEASVPEAQPVETVVEPAIQESVSTQPTSLAIDEDVQPKVNGIAHTETSNKEPEPVEEPAAEPVREPTPVPEDEPAPVDAPPAAEEPAQSAPPAPSNAPPASTSTSTPAQPQQPPAPSQPAAPSAPKTWANLAAANSNKWGNAVAQEAKGVSAAAVTPTSGASTPSKDGRTTPARAPKGDQHSSAYQAAMAVTSTQCFVKGVAEVVSHQNLQAILNSRFGPTKEVEVVRSKGCAFVEFVNVDSARRAIIACLPQNQGGEGGLRIDGGDAGTARVIVETKKERADRAPGGHPGARQRTTSGGGDQRGGFRGRGGAGGGRGRGGQGGQK